MGGRLDPPLASSAHAPGPADYNPAPITNTTGPKIAEPKGKPPTVNASLGPGHYTPKDTIYDHITSNSYLGTTLKGREAFEDVAAKWAPPAPGEYDAAKVGAIGSSGRVTTITGRNFPKTPAEKHEGPAPNEYTVKTDITRASKPTYSIGERREEVIDKAQVPGPGQYPLPSTLIEKGTRIGTGI